MKHFAALFEALDAGTSTNGKVQAMVQYFEQATPQDAAWAVYFLSGGKPRQVVPTKVLRSAVLRSSGLSEWLFEECYQAVGDLAETIAHVLPAPTQDDETGLAVWVEERLARLRGQEVELQEQALAQYWSGLDTTGRFLLTKLIGGGFRVGVSKLLVIRALAQFAQLEAGIVAQRMMGYTDKTALPTAATFTALIVPHEPDATTQRHSGQPYPFFLAHPLQISVEELGDVKRWQAEWKYDGIRAQVVKRNGTVWIWSRNEELITEQFPDVVAQCQSLPDGTVLDGELLAWPQEVAQAPTEALGLSIAPAAFNLLQQRLGRKTLTKKILQQVPVRLLAYDVLEFEYQDRRTLPQHERRVLLEHICQRQIAVSPLVQADEWAQLTQVRCQSRSRSVEGLMLKHASSQYGIGRTKSGEHVWYKWKIDPLTIDCVLIYAQAGHGRRASLYTDYTFAVWSQPPQDAQQVQDVINAFEQKRLDPGLPQLVPFAKAYSGLTDEEFKAVDAIIRKTTIEKFGPVRSVKPSMVFELGFEGINASTRHKSGIAVRFPRMLRWRTDKPLHEANTLADLRVLLNTAGSGYSTVANE